MKSKVQFSEFSSGNGLKEKFYAMTSVKCGTFEEEFKCLMETYKEVAPDDASEVMLRLHLSDAPNQVPYLRDALSSRNSFVSLVGQPSVDGAAIALEAWHVEGLASKTRDKDVLDFKTKHYGFMLANSHDLESSGSYDQTREEFEKIETLLASRGGTVCDNLHRTWLYCDDIDYKYQGLVEARNAFFEEHNLTSKTHFIASTGIQGHMEKTSRFVKMDSLAIFGSKPEQIEYMEALTHLCPTHHYGVAFERGTRVIYGDRSSYYISGTASIDDKGDVLHIGDPGKQTERAIENIKALMENHQGSIKDMKQAIVYLRHAEHQDIVRSVLEESELSHVPYIMLDAPVCRPTWLVEIDGIAVNASGNKQFPDFE